MPPPQPTVPAKPPAQPAMPEYDRTTVGWMQDPARGSFPRGRDFAAAKDNMNTLYGPGGPGAANANRLSEAVHGPRMRTDIHKSMVKQGYPLPVRPDGSRTPVSETHVNAYQKAYPFASPPIDVTEKNPTQFNPGDGNISLNPKPSYMMPGMNVTSMRHEIDHALQYPKDWASETKTLNSDPWMHSVEVGPSLGDMMWMSQDHQAVTGKPLNHAVTYPNGYSQNTAWMNRQAQQHGLYQPNGSMTRMLATPSGQAYLRQIAAPQTGDLVADMNMSIANK